MIIVLDEFPVAILTKTAAIEAGKVVCVVRRVLYEVGRVYHSKPGILGGNLHLREIGPFSVFVVHGSSGIVIAVHRIDTACYKEAIAYPSDSVAEVADRAAGLYDRSGWRESVSI